MPREPVELRLPGVCALCRDRGATGLEALALLLAVLLRLDFDFVELCMEEALLPRSFASARDVE